MRKILMRSNMPFGGVNNVSKIVIDDLVGDNVGNLLFYNSVSRTLMTEETEITTIRTSKSYTDEEMEVFNSEYEAFIIPLANAFRNDFKTEFVNMTRFIKKLRIPCIVIGIGLQRSLNQKNWDYDIEDVAREFLKEVLKKSAVIGLRGEHTADYMKHIGFTPEKDFTVIGCPSMYILGDRLPEIRKKNITTDSKVAVNYTMTMFPEVYRQSLQFNDCTYVTQVIKEIANLYVGAPHPQRRNNNPFIKDHYPMTLDHPKMVNKKLVGFVDELSWIKFSESMDFVFGSRIHGNIVNCLAGTPCYILVQDERVKELVEYHNIPHILMNDIKDTTNILDLYNSADYSLLLNGHKERVSRYLDFFDKNQIKRIDRETLNSQDAPFDRFLRAQPVPGPVYAFSVQDQEEMIRRTVEYTSALHDRNDILKTRFMKLLDAKADSKKKLDEKNALIKRQKKELENIKCRKSYKLQVKLDSIFKK